MALGPLGLPPHPTDSPGTGKALLFRELDLDPGHQVADGKVLLPKSVFGPPQQRGGKEGCRKWLKKERWWWSGVREQSGMEPGGLRPQLGSTSKQAVGTCIGDLIAPRLSFPMCEMEYDHVQEET